MSESFFRSEGLLRADDARAIRSLCALVLVLSLAWVVWLFKASVPLYAISNRARLESATLHWVDAPVEGRVTNVLVKLGEQVRSGQVLVELDATSERLRESEQDVRSTTTGTAIERARRAIELESAALLRLRESSAAAELETTARYREAEELALLAEAEARRANELHRNGLVSELERDRAASEAASRRAAAATFEAAMRRSRIERQIEEGTHRAALETLRGELDALLRDARTSSLTKDILVAEVEKRLIRSPVSGRIGTEIAVRNGSTVELGTRLTSIVPEDGVIVVAYFRPETVSGRVEVGQTAHLSLDAFSVIEYGWLTGRVSRAATEPQDGLLRVEVAFDGGPTRVPLRHGMTGQLRIETERTSPLTLVLRSAGKRMMASSQSSPLPPLGER